MLLFYVYYKADVTSVTPPIVQEKSRTFEQDSANDLVWCDFSHQETLRPSCIPKIFVPSLVWTIELTKAR